MKLALNHYLKHAQERVQHGQTKKNHKKFPLSSEFLKIVPTGYSQSRHCLLLCPANAESIQTQSPSLPIAARGEKQNRIKQISNELAIAPEVQKTIRIGMREWRTASELVLGAEYDDGGAARILSSPALARRRERIGLRAPKRRSSPPLLTLPPPSNRLRPPALLHTFRPSAPDAIDFPGPPPRSPARRRSCDVRRARRVGRCGSGSSLSAAEIRSGGAPIERFFAVFGASQVRRGGERRR